MELNYYEIGQRIRKYRKAHNLSQEQLAENVNISITHLSHIETGNTKMSLSVFVAIADALSVQTDELLRDNLDNKESTQKEVLNILDSCTTQEAYILKDILKTTKPILSKYIN